MQNKHIKPELLSDSTKFNQASLFFSFRWFLDGATSFKLPTKATSCKQMTVPIN